MQHDIPLPGPLDTSVLYLQNKHRSSRIWNSEEVTNLQIWNNLGCWRRELRSPMHDSVLQYLVQTGFYGAYCVGFRKVDWDLTEALVERWRQETHSFHLPVGECTVTLQDVEVLWGLPVDGTAVTNITDNEDVPQVVWLSLCSELLGFIPEVNEVKGGRLCMGAIARFIEHNNIVDTSSDVEVQQQARCYIILILGGLFGYQSGTMKNLIYLPLLQDMSTVHTYSWGSAILAPLYSELCTATLPTTHEITGPLLLLQYWAWEHMGCIRSDVKGRGRNAHQIRQGFPAPPRGHYWTNANLSHRRSPGHALLVYRDALDQMLSEQMCWEPYNQLALPQYCMAGVRVWTSRSPMINFNIVELYCPDRVLRQFGMRQHVLKNCNTDEALHQIDRRGRTGADWAQLHRNYIQAWESRHVNAVGAERASPYLHYSDPYMVWYRSITRIRIGPLHVPVPPSGYRAGAYIRDALAEQLARVLAMSQDAMQIGQSSEYIQTLQQVHGESYGRLEHLGMSHLIPPPGTTSQHYTDPQPSSPTRQVPNQFAHASSSHGTQNHTFSDYGDRGGASVLRDIYDAYQYSYDAYQHSARLTYYEGGHSGAPQPDEEYVQPTYEYAQRNYYEHVHSPAPRPDQEPVHGEEDAQNEGLTGLGPHQSPRCGPRTRGGRLNRGQIQTHEMNAPIPDDAQNEGLTGLGPHQSPHRGPRTRGGRLNRGQIQTPEMNAPIPEDAQNEGLSTLGPHQSPRRGLRTRGGRLNRGQIQTPEMNASIPEDEEYVPHYDPTYVHQRQSRYGRQIRTPGCGT